MSVVETLRDTLRQAYADDWREPISRGLIWIKDKSGTLVRFVPNSVQQELIDYVWQCDEKGIPVRVIIPKARQIGISTAIEVMIYCKAAFTTGIRAGILADEAKKSTNILEMSKRIHKKMNIVVRSETQASNAKELVFADIDSKIEIDTAENRDAMRSGTYQILHSSETAYYPDAAYTFTGSLQCVPNLPNTWVFMESTGNGVGGYFYEKCMNAYTGTGGYHLFFVPWYNHSEYTQQIPDGYDLTLQPAGQYGNEIAIAEKYNLTPEQVYWRRNIIETNCNNDLLYFQQEYPATLDECFIGSGLPVFNQELLLQIQASAVNIPSWYGTFETGSVELNSSRVGTLQVWKQPDTIKYRNRYVIAADTGGNWDGADYSCAYVFDRLHKEIVARIYGHINPYDYAKQLVATAKYYQNAKLAIEINKWDSETDDNGVAVIDRVRTELKYSNLYTRKVKDKNNGTETHEIGFHMNVSTKPSVVDRLTQFVNEYANNPIKVNDAKLIKEMQSYVILQTKTGKTTWGASEGCNDDTVMAFGIALYVSREMPRVENDIPLEFNYEHADDPLRAIA